MKLTRSDTEKKKEMKSSEGTEGRVERLENQREQEGNLNSILLISIKYVSKLQGSQIKHTHTHTKEKKIYLK